MKAKIKEPILGVTGKSYLGGLSYTSHPIRPPSTVIPTEVEGSFLQTGKS